MKAQETFEFRQNVPLYLNGSNVDVMATLTIKNFPDELYHELTQIAKKNRRSLNSEAIVSVERGIERGQDETKPELLERIRDRREKLAGQGVVLTDDLLRKFKTEGRP